MKREYLVLSRGQWDRTLSPEAIQRAIDAFYAWYEAGLAGGTLKPGHRLAREGRSSPGAPLPMGHSRNRRK
jgi:hypothetical protein